MTRTIRSRFDHEVGGMVEGCTILEKCTVIPPEPAERRRGVYEYVVEGPQPAAIKSSDFSRKPVTPERGSFVRSTPDDRGGVIRRVPSR
jgi:hypothetical protein